MPIIFIILNPYHEYNRLITINKRPMAEEIIDFGNFSKRINVNPIIPLQILNLKCRIGNRIQATILGKVYSSHIDILEIVPVGICEENKVKTIDFAEHQRSLENITSVFPNLQIIGVAVTDLAADRNLAVLHTMYVNKQSGFKAQGILNYPIILSVGTKFGPQSKNYSLEAFSFNQTYRHCKDIMDVTAFERLEVNISLGDADFESMTPWFEAVNDQEKVVPHQNAGELMNLLALRLKELKLHCDKESGQALKISLRDIISRIGAKQCISTEELSFLLDLTGLQKRIALKTNKFM